MTYHIAIIGAYGSAGAAAAESLADEPSVELTLIDDGDPGGGLCILRGCMPSKEVLSAGAHRFQVRHDHRIVGETPEVDLEATVETKNEHTSDFAAGRRKAIHELAERDNVEFVHDTARFVDDRTIAVGDRTITPDYVVIATGSTVNVPELPGIDAVEYMTSADVLDATQFPDSGIVMGFGYVGLELVPYLAEAGGMDLTVIEHDAHPVDEADPGFGQRVSELYQSQFDIDIRSHTYEKRLEPTAEGGVRLHAEQAGDEVAIEADQLFVFTGRRPTVDGLGLENTRLSDGSDAALDAEWIEATMQAREDPRIFAVGDVNGHEPILHVAKEQGFLAADNILRHAAGDDLVPYENVHHHVIFSGLGVYPFVRIGHSEQSAREAGEDFVAVEREATDDGVFKTKDVPYGFAKLVVDATDGTVLGYQGLHYHADVMAKTMQMAVEMELDAREIPDRAYHPTTPEIIDGLLRDATSELEE